MKKNRRRQALSVTAGGVLVAIAVCGCGRNTDIKGFHELDVAERGAVKELLRNVCHDCVKDVEPGVQTFGLYVGQSPCPKTGKELSTLSTMPLSGTGTVQ